MKNLYFIKRIVLLNFIITQSFISISYAETDTANKNNFFESFNLIYIIVIIFVISIIVYYFRNEYNKNIEKEK